MGAPVDVRVAVPEIGSSLGRVAVPGGTDPLDLDDIRERLLQRVLQMTDEARRAAARGDHGGMLIALGRSAWLEGWEWAVRAAADRVARSADEALLDTAWRVRLPGRRRRHLPLSPEERRTLAARLGSEGGAFVESLDRLELAATELRRPDVPDARAVEAWQHAVLGTVRRLETAWVALLDASRRERAAWLREADLLLAWKPSLWPVFVVALPVAALLLWLGLITGGYVQRPAWFPTWLP